MRKDMSNYQFPGHEMTADEVAAMAVEHEARTAADAKRQEKHAAIRRMLVEVQDMVFLIRSLQSELAVRPTLDGSHPTGMNDLGRYGVKASLETAEDALVRTAGFLFSVASEAPTHQEFLGKV
jgi:hypothetical protein